jgi:hypothetical protein
LTYVWSVDGTEVAQGDRPSWQIPDTSTAGQRRVTVEVFDKGGLKDQVAWNVTVKALAQPPLIANPQPRDEKVIVNAGEPLDFSITARVPGGASPRLRYQWSVNNASPSQTDTGRFRFTETKPGTYELTAVAISPEGLESSPRKWTIEVRPVVVTPLSLPPSLEFSEAEVRTWLETTYQQAWERKDIEALVQLGVVPPQEAANLKETFSRFKDYRVEIRNIDIRMDGKNRAVVKIVRIDTVQNRRSSPYTQELTLEKQSDGRLSVRNVLAYR